MSQNGQTHSNNFLSVFDHFVVLALKVLTLERLLIETAMIEKKYILRNFFSKSTTSFRFLEISALLLTQTEKKLKTKISVMPKKGKSARNLINYHENCGYSFLAFLRVCKT